MTGQRVGVIGHGPLGAREALFLRTYADQLTLIHIAAPDALLAEERALLAQAGVTLIETPIESVELQPDRPRALCFSGAERVEFDALYSALGVTPRTGLALAVGARHDDQGRLVVDDHQQTSIPGLLRGRRHGARPQPDLNGAGRSGDRRDGHAQPPHGESSAPSAAPCCRERCARRPPDDAAAVLEPAALPPAALNPTL